MRLRPILEVGALVLLVAVGVVVYLVASGDDDDGGDATPSESTTAEAEAPPPDWPAPPDPMERTRAAGLEPAVHEHLEVHRHAHLDVFYNGASVTVPAGIGIDVTDPGVQTFDTPDGPGYGGIEECDEPCISPLHTHDATGIIHTESTIEDLSTLGQFFTEWDVRLDGECVGDYCAPETEIAVYVNGDHFDGNPADIRLDDREEIAIVIGSPPDEIPDTADFSQA